jgi:outer membrane protein assembly factor BamB
MPALFRVSIRLRRSLALCLLCLAATNVLAAEPAARGWPQFLGPNRNGISSETGLIEAFGPDGPKVVWRVRGGKGMSGLAVDGKQAVTMLERGGKQWVVALDLQDGSELWSQSIADAFRNAMGPGPRATPTISGGRIFVYTGEGILAALDQTTGAVRWQHDVVDALGAKLADYGMACSPLVVDGLVVVSVGAEGASIAAYQADTGRLAWKSGDDTAGYSSPALLTVGGRRQIVAFTGQSAVGLEPKTGAQLWRYKYTTDFDCNIATPIAVGEDVFISSGENHGCALLSLKPQGEKFQVSEVWKSFGPTSVMRNEWQTSVLLDGFLYGLDNVGGAGPVTHLNCVNAKTGARVWQKTRFGKGNLIAADGKLYFVTVDGELVIVRANPERFEELARAKVCEGTRQAPALLDGRLYLRDTSDIICVDIRASK